MHRFRMDETRPPESIWSTAFWRPKTRIAYISSYVRSIWYYLSNTISTTIVRCQDKAQKQVSWYLPVNRHPVTAVCEENQTKWTKNEARGPLWGRNATRSSQESNSKPILQLASSNYWFLLYCARHMRGLRGIEHETLPLGHGPIPLPHRIPDDCWPADFMFAYIRPIET